MAKYAAVAYLLWLFLGWAGVHHFYLGRRRQGVLWLTSFSGLFGLGEGAMHSSCGVYSCVCRAYSMCVGA